MPGPDSRPATTRGREDGPGSLGFLPEGQGSQNERETAMNNKRWYQRCVNMTLVAVGMSMGNLWSASGASFGPQMAAAVLLLGAGLIAYMTKTAP